LDLTDQGFISGQGDRFAGGVTAATGTSKTAVRNRAARPGGVRGGRGTKPTKGTAHVRRGPDLSRPPKVLDMAILQSCPFPPESDVEQTNLAYVNVAILVGTNGKAESVSLLSESPAGQGFGREARRCALRVRYESGLDRTGNRSPQSIHVRFRFTR
jgi:protein TonB